MLNLVATERRSSSFSLLGTRAYFGAHAGVNWAANKIGTDPTVCPAPVTVFNIGEAALTGYQVTVSCSLTDHLEGDRYFPAHREGHNLDRARAQFALLRSLERLG